MFKYKSPLSRLLEGAGKTKDEECVEQTAPEADKPEPIADFNALRQALAGGNMTSDNYEETDELIPEEKMPEFTADEDLQPEESAVDLAADAAEPAAEDQDIPVAVTVLAVEPEAVEEEQIVTLRLTPENSVVDEAPVSITEMSPTIEEAPAEEVVEVLVEPEIQPEPEPVQQEPVQAPAPPQDRSARVKTTFLGFERADTHVQELIETAEPVAKTEAVKETFPVGWLVVTSGPGRGASIALTEGLMQIGRNDDQAIQLDFGDTGISRSNHAVIAYDPEDRKCYLGHGGKANLVRLNGKPVLSTVPLASGDLIRISETSIRFAAFCDDDFDWRDS